MLRNPAAKAHFMELHSQIFGHVAFAIPATLALQSAEEEHENTMFRCRYSKKLYSQPHTSLVGFLPQTNEIIHNPQTLQDLAYIFHTSIEQAFAS